MAFHKPHIGPAGRGFLPGKTFFKAVQFRLEFFPGHTIHGGIIPQCTRTEVDQRDGSYRVGIMAVQFPFISLDAVQFGITYAFSVSAAEPCAWDPVKNLERV